MTVDLAASQRHYLDHLLPIWRALPADARGDVFLPAELAHLIPDARPLPAVKGPGVPVLIAAGPDLRQIDGRPVILTEHGCGQSYNGDPATAGNVAYAGGIGRYGIAGFICINEYAAAPNRAAYPDVYTAVVGSGRLAQLQTIAAPPFAEKPVVAVSFHWDCPVAPESRSGWRHWYRAVEKLGVDERFTVLGHAHPRHFRDLAPLYREWGIEPVESFDEVVARAHVYCCDNSSTLFEFAAVRGPVVVLDAPWYRPDVHHGLRFWDAADVGPRIMDGAALPGAIRAALRRQPWPGAEEILARIFPAVADPAAAGAEAVLEAARRAAGVRPHASGRFPHTARSRG